MELKAKLSGNVAPFVLPLLSVLFSLSFAADTLTRTQPIRDGQNLVLAGGTFELGFFSPGAFTLCYLGIWYMHIPVQNVVWVWVANRACPLPDRSGLLQLGPAGEHLLTKGSNHPIWTTDQVHLARPVAQLLDSGNFVLRDAADTVLLVGVASQSFHCLIYTWVPGMRFSSRFPLGLPSWKDSDDASFGEYTVRLDENGLPQLFLWGRSSPVCRTGPWNGLRLSGTPEMKSYTNLLTSYAFVSNDDESYYEHVLNDPIVITRPELDQTSELKRFIWVNQTQSRNVYWSASKDWCDVYVSCGPFGIGSTGSNPACKCVERFEPRSARKVSAGIPTCGKRDGLGRVTGLKFPDTRASIVNLSMGIEDCKPVCPANCNEPGLVPKSKMGKIHINLDHHNPKWITLVSRTSYFTTYRSLTFFFPTQCGIFKERPHNLFPSKRQHLHSQRHPQRREDFRDGPNRFKRWLPSHGYNTLPYVALSSCTFGWYVTLIPYCNDSSLVTHESVLLQESKTDKVHTNLDHHSPKRIPLVSYPSYFTTYKPLTFFFPIRCKILKEGPHNLSPLKRQCSRRQKHPPGRKKYRDRLYYMDNYSDILDADEGGDNKTHGPLNKNKDNKTHGPVNKNKLTIIIAATISLSLLLLQMGLCILWKKKLNVKAKKNPCQSLSLLSLGANVAYSSMFIDENTTSNGGNRSAEFLPISLDAIGAATDNFSEENKLGEGGFGPVYKGKLPNGQEVAIKRLSGSSRQGLEEFKNEVILITRLQHMNLVRLLGFCTQEEEKMLIYEYMPNKSLDSILFDPAKGAMLDWSTRKRIIDGIAQGILYLHEYSRLKVIHRDLKASNILLDAEFNPKISDFGIAKIFDGNQKQGETERIVGTRGYMPPEYIQWGNFSEKSDIFSYGVLLLEIISGMKISDFQHINGAWNLLQYAWDLWREGRVLELADPLLGNSYCKEELLKYMHVVLSCVQESAQERPTMSSVVFQLGAGNASLPPPNLPAFHASEGQVSGNFDSRRGSNGSSNEVTITMMEAR